MEAVMGAREREDRRRVPIVAKEKGVNCERAAERVLWAERGVFRHLLLLVAVV